MNDIVRRFGSGVVLAMDSQACLVKVWTLVFNSGGVACLGQVLVPLRFF